MSILHLASRTEQRFAVAYPPDTAFRYFARNEDLLGQFLGVDRVQRLEPGVYRITLNAHGALGLNLRPSFDVAFHEFPGEAGATGATPPRVEMRSLRASLVEASHDDAGFDARFLGEAIFHPDPEGTRVVCWATMAIDLALPAVLAWMPSGPLELIGNGIIDPALRALGGRLVPLMQRDIHRWVVRHPPGSIQRSEPIV